MKERPIPWPRIGNSVLLKSGHTVEVLTVIRGADALRSKTEFEILMLGPTMQAAVGSDWMNLYYEATVQYENEKIAVVTPREVKSIVP